MTSVMSARSPLSIRRCRESVFPLAAGDKAQGKEESHTRTDGSPPSSHHRKTKGRGSCPAARHMWLSKFVMWLLGYRID